MAFDFAVVGGGLVGASIAWGMAGAGARVAVLDEGDVALRASRGNFALVWVQGKGRGMPAYAHWTVQSAGLWPEFARLLAEQSGLDVRYERPGGLLPALSEAELHESRQHMEALQRDLGPSAYPYEILDHGALARRAPQVGRDVRGAVYCPLDGHVNSLRLLHALHVGLDRHSASYFPGTRVESVERVGGVFRLTSANRVVEAQRVLLAAGHGNVRLAPMVGLSAPVRPTRGHIIVTERTAPFLKDQLFLTIRQTDEGTVMIGASIEEVGFDDRLNLGVLAAMAERAIRIFPQLGRLNAVRSWAALRVMTPDGFPIYQESTSHPGAFIATCHSGVTLAAAHALQLAPMLLAGKLSHSLYSFTAGRFHVPQAA
jgi:glycine/D-amino acid oxidase-like deaminating enzyme